MSKVASLHVLVFACLITVCLCKSTESTSSKPTLVAYLPEYRVPDEPSTLLSKVTDLILFSAEPQLDGSLAYFLSEEKIHKLVRAAADLEKRPRLLLCIGGGGRSSNFPHVLYAGDDVMQQKFINTLASAMNDLRLDGIDIDWEDRIDDVRAGLLARFVRKLRKAVSTRNILITIALHPGQSMGKKAKGKTEPKLSRVVDRIHLMTYDMISQSERRHATLASVLPAIEHLSSQGVPKGKISMGIPAYGRALQNPGDVKTYQELVESMPVFDPSIDEVNGFYFNGISTAVEKATHCLAHGLSGVMLWEAGQDTQDPNTSLLTAMGEALHITTNQQQHRQQHGENQVEL